MLSRYFTLRNSLLGIALLALPVFTYLLWHSSSPTTLSTLDTYQEAGKGVKQDFQSLPSLPLTQTDEAYQIEDTTKDGIDIQFANQTESLTQGEEKKDLNLSFPKDYSKPIDIKLDEQRAIHITDLGGKDDYTVDTLTQEDQSLRSETPKLDEEQKNGFFKRLFQLSGRVAKSEESYLRYTSKDGRKSLLYAYQKDQATGEKKLKHWTLYKEGDGIEHEEYQIDNAKVKVNEEGVAEVFYYGQEQAQKDIQNEQVKAEVDSNLMERAQRTLAKEMGEDLLNGNKTPDFTIPSPYYIDREGEKHDAEWKWHEETKSLSVNFTPESYPVALDPTLSFTAPGVSNGGSVIDGESGTGSQFGYAVTAGDFNSDGRIDLAVGANAYSTNTGRAYIFYNDGAITTNAGTADVIITGETTSNQFGVSLASGDFNADGRTDLVVGASSYSTNTGRAYIFHNDGSIPTTAATADVTITGNATQDRFASVVISGDFNADGKTDLAISAYGYSSFTGRAYLFYNDGSIPTTAATADVTITGDTTNNYFGSSLASGDWNADGRTDLAVGAYFYSTATGRAYIFHNDGSIPTTAATADVTITGEVSSAFGLSLTSGDFNADGKTDLAVGAYGYSTNTGRAYIFHNDGSIPTTAATADVTITGETTSSYFGYSMTAGDFNADGKTDLAVGAYRYFSDTGRAYILYNDGSIPTTAATADVTITGETTSNYFGYTLASGDWNADGRTDLAVGAYGYSSSTGRIYLFYSQNGQVNTNQSITGNATSDEFGKAMVTGDFNADGRIDLAVGAPGYNPGGAASTGRVYIFYGDGQIPTGAGTADVTITGNAASDLFGSAFAAGDFNADGKTDLAIGASGYSTNTGRAYIFYGDGSIPTTAATADVTITGESTNNYFGASLTQGDMNSDGKNDIIVGASQAGSGAGAAYLFYNDGSIPTTAATADVKISGESSSSLGGSMATGDINSDGRTDLVIGASQYGTYGGRTYLFYNDGSIPTTAATADLIITSEGNHNYFGGIVALGDLNADGRDDLVVGAVGLGYFYIFYNDGSIPTGAASADVTISGRSTGSSNHGKIVIADINNDGRKDLIGSDLIVSTNTGRAYIFYNDDSFPATVSTADLTLTGETTSNYFGYAMTAGDMNGDGRADLVVGAYGNTSSTGKVYLYETRENFSWKLQKQVGGTLRTGLNTSGQELKITGEASSSFGIAMTTGDLNSDGKSDLIVGASGYISNTGRVYVFYSDGSLATSATNADAVISGSGTAYFGYAVATGDINNDSRTDLIVGAYGTSFNTGKTFVFYNDGTFPGSSAAADLTITGEANSYFGSSLVTGDFNADGWIDLAVGAHLYNNNWTGRVYVFYGDSAIPTTAATADVTITGEAANNRLGSSLAAADLNADGKVDLAVSAIEYSASAFTGRVYIFYNGSIITENASGADIIISGEGSNYNFGRSIAVGDFNFDGKVDLAAGATGYGSGAGRAYIFYNGSIITENSNAADVIISGESGSSFGISVAAGDFNADGRTDLAVGGHTYSTSTGRSYVFYNDGSIPTTAATADMTLTGEATSDAFGAALVSGDFNADGRTDLAVGATGYSSSKGRIYVYTFGNDQVITGEATTNYFGTTLTTGDLNADGKTDLVVGAFGYSTATGRAYVFYNDGAFASTAATADVIITGETTNNNFGFAVSIGDFNTDGKADLAVGAYRYSTYTGRAYLFYADGTNNFGTTTCSGTPAACSASNADVTITGSANSSFGARLAAGDVNASGTTDLIVGTDSGWTYADVAYIFYNDGSIPTTAATADVTITGTGGSYFSIALAVGDFNSDGRIDLAIGDNSKAYIFYNDGSIPTTSATADVTITGDSLTSFGNALAAGDFNADGRTDLVVGAPGYSTSTGRAYVFYNDGSIPTTAATADVTITGETTNNYFGIVLAAGDMNADGKTDLIISAYRYATFTGRVYVFHNDGSYPTAASTADMVMTGASAVGSPSFGVALALGDLNTDGLMDLAVGANYSQAVDTSGKAYILSSEAAVSDVSTEPLKTRGTLKTRGNIKIR